MLPEIGRGRIPLKTAERHISQWRKDGIIERIEQGKYMKV